MIRRSIFAAALALTATAAQAQDTDPPKEVTVSGSVGLVSDYRFRGVYIGTWGSNLSGWGTFGGANMELDLVAGFKFPVGGGALDIGATWYMYPGGFDNTDFIEPYVKLSGTLGPASLLAGVAYAPEQEALGSWYLNGASAAAGVYDKPGDKNDNLYIWGDAAVAITGTPLTAKAHIGYSKGNKGLGPFATSVAPTGEYIDWLLGVDLAVPSTPLTIGVAYVDTDISNREAAYLQPSFSKGQDGSGSIANGKVLASLTAAF